MAKVKSTITGFYFSFILHGKVETRLFPFGMSYHDRWNRSIAFLHKYNSIFNQFLTYMCFRSNNTYMDMMIKDIAVTIAKNEIGLLATRIINRKHELRDD
jgi:hypothetical protein